MWRTWAHRLLAALLSGIAVAALACGGEKQEAKGTAAPGGAAQATGYTPAPRDQQRFVVNMGATPDFLDPHKS